MKFNNEDTIIAVATPSGSGAISVIRVSGSRSIEIADKFFYGKIKLNEAPSHTIHHGKIISKDNKVIDDVLVSIFRAPNSYTGEDSIEISCHGNQFIAESIIKCFLENNLRIAEPGEFTKRAFLNGKIDLAQAEAVVDIINSRTEASLRGARNQMDGLLSAKIEFLKNALLEISSLLELELDFAEEDIELLTKKEIEIKIITIINEIDILLKTYSFGKVIKDGLNIAIVGEPNVGKSSLLNYLLREARAIVSEIPGTTRDIIHEDISIDGLLIKLYDTAGIRHSEDSVEKEGVDRSKRIIKDSDLVLFVVDVTQPYPDKLYNELLNFTKKEHILIVCNKIDLRNDITPISDVRISCRTGDGIEDLLSIIKNKSFGGFYYSENSAILTNSRHFIALSRAKEHLYGSIQALVEKMSGEFIAIHIRNAETCLGEIIGKVTSDDILNNIFSRFCIGK
jgi:tRNA modification GTPase